MAHLLEQMAYVGETPWHGLGNALTPRQPLEVWAEQAGMAFQIDRREEDLPARLDERRARADDACRLGDVLKHLHAGDDVETRRRFVGEFLGGDLAVFDFLAALEQVQSGDAERLVGEVD